MQLIARQELTSAAASITFSSIPQTFTDLYLTVSARAATGGQINSDMVFKLNGSTANYSYRQLVGSGSGVSSSSTVFGTGTSYLGVTNGSDSTANTFGSISAHFPNYTASAAKSVSTDSVGENNATASFQMIGAALWNDTTAISSLEVYFFAGWNLVAGSSASLFGVLAGSDGIVTVS
jgi:hypothetical protein